MIETITKFTHIRMLLWPYAEGSRRTSRRWCVQTLKGFTPLGEISWYSGWRCYVFKPLGGTVFEKQCLHDIAGFCETATLQQKKQRTPDDKGKYGPSGTYDKMGFIGR